MSIFVLDVTHALIVDDAQRQDAVHHGLTVDDVAIEQHSWVIWTQKEGRRLRAKHEV